MGIRNKGSGSHEGKAPHEGDAPFEGDAPHEGKATPKKHRKSHKGEVDEGVVPIRGDEKLADDLAMRAYGDKDHDGKPDVPNVPFPD
ncbi:hypothetical protein GCM10023081_15600 [Arthrobacter ginkgonis]|uniref:Uncharacterized protein n=1 Tax=Arthrobacter ginkgonis TaxID=1630594 RepID=A0ABP7C4P5_9MICC